MVHLGEVMPVPLQRWQIALLSITTCPVPLQFVQITLPVPLQTGQVVFACAAPPACSTIMDEQMKIPIKTATNNLLFVYLFLTLFFDDIIFPGLT